MALITPNWSLDGVIMFLSLTMCLYFYMTRNFKYWKKRDIMEVSPIPFVGNFLNCVLQKISSSYFLKDLYDQADGLPYIGFYIFDKPSLLIRDRELVKHVLVKDFNFFSDRNAQAHINDRIGHTNLFMIGKPGWKTLRTKLTPIFTSGKLKKMFQLMVEVSDDLTRYLETHRLEGDGKTLELKELAAKFATDLIGTTAFGLKADSLNNPDAEFRKYGRMIFDFTTFRSLEMLSIFYIPRLVPVIGASLFGKECSNYLRSVFWQALNDREKSGEKREDLINLLIDLKNKHGDEDVGGFKFSGDDLLAQACVFFTAGYETSSTATSFSLYHLALQPEIQETARNEILEALSKTSGKVTYDMITNLPYLDMVISETLRMYPPLAFLDRKVVEDYKLPNSNVVLEKGTPIFISMLGSHYNPEYFPEPEKYDPERFNEENKKSIPPFAYFPFGEGPRICIGLRLGMLQVKLGLITILREYEVRPCKETITPVQIDPKALTTSVIGGINLNIRKISTRKD